MFVIARFLLGFGIPFAIVAASSMIGELAYPKERARIGSLFNASWFIGAIVAAGVTLGTFEMPTNWGWRIPSVLQVIPSLLQITFIWFLPESPRWLVSKGRGEEAYAILAKYHAEGDLNSEFVRLEFAEIEETLKLEKEQAGKSSWRQLVSAPGMRRRLIICSFLGLATQWSGNGLTSYFLARILDNVGIHDDRTKNLINLAMTCWGFVNATTLALTAPRFRRRTMYLTCTISLTLIFTGWTIASAQYSITGSQAASRAVIAFIFLYSPAYNLGFNALTYSAFPSPSATGGSNALTTCCGAAYLVELFPFHARAKGIAVFQWWGRAAGFFNQFVNPIGINNAGWKYYISYCIFLLFEIGVVWFLFPETSNQTLEELAFRECPLLTPSGPLEVLIGCVRSVRGRQGPRGAAKAYRGGSPRGQGSDPRQCERQGERAACRAQQDLSRRLSRPIHMYYHVSDNQSLVLLLADGCVVIASSTNNSLNSVHSVPVYGGSCDNPLSSPVVQCARRS